MEFEIFFGSQKFFVKERFWKNFPIFFQVFILITSDLFSPHLTLLLSFCGVRVCVMVCVWVRMVWVCVCVALFVCLDKRCARIRSWQLQRLLVLVFERIFLFLSLSLFVTFTHTPSLSLALSLSRLTLMKKKREIHHSRRFFQLATNQLFWTIFNFVQTLARWLHFSRTI